MCESMKLLDFHKSFIYSFYKYLLNIFLPGILLDTRDAIVKKKSIYSMPSGSSHSSREDKIKLK
jgi:hypothetical protein